MRKNKTALNYRHSFRLVTNREMYERAGCICSVVSLVRDGNLSKRVLFCAIFSSFQYRIVSSFLNNHSTNAFIIYIYVDGHHQTRTNCISVENCLWLCNFIKIITRSYILYVESIRFSLSVCMSVCACFLSDIRSPLLVD